MTAIDGDRGAEHDSPRSGEGALSELIELEKQIESRIAQAETQAERIVEEGRRLARAAEEDGAGSLEEVVRALRASIEQECAASLRAVAERAEVETEDYRRVDDATLSRLSQWVASRVLRGSESA
jgi:vacuolar-type H+-ATPase subunit H